MPAMRGRQAGSSVGRLRPADLIDRDREVAELAHQLDRAIAGDGGATLVRGPLGAGTSALVQYAADIARGRGMSTLAAAAAPALDSEPLNLARRLLAPLSAPGERDDGSGMSRLVGLVARAANGRPLALIADDLQAADDASVRFLAQLSRWSVGRPVVLVLGLSGHDQAGADAAVAELTAAAQRTLIPRPLTCDGTRALLERELAQPVDDAVASACHEATTGRPARVLDSARGLVLRGLAPTAGNAGAARDIALAGVAAALRATLGDGERLRLAVAAAVLDEAATAARLAAVAEIAPATAGVLLDDLRRDDVIVGYEQPRVGRRADADALLATMPAAEIASFRRRAAGLLAAEGDSVAAATQLLGLAPSAAAADADILRQGAAAVLDHGAPELAVALLQRLLAEPLAATRRVDVLSALGRVQVATGTAAAWRRCGRR